MQVAQILEHLARDRAFYCDGEDAAAQARRPIEVIETHASVVILRGDKVFKLKKPVDFGFLDYSSVGKRRFCWEQEVALNRRLAREVYLGVVPIVATSDGTYRFAIEECYQPPLRARAARVGNDCEDAAWIPAHWLEVCVYMRRLPHEACLHARLVEGRWPYVAHTGAALAGDAALEVVTHLGQRIAAFHREQPAAADERDFVSAHEIESACRENLNALEACSIALDRTWSTEIRAAQERVLAAAPLAARATSSAIVHTHGDLRLDHVYVAVKGLAAPLIVIDCVEFNPRFSINDGVADVAFLAMELRRHGKIALAEAFLAAYFSARGDERGVDVLTLYQAYRALVRAKVEGLRAGQSGVSQAERIRATREVWAHLQVAATILGVDSRRPGLVLIGGLPGTGKSTLSAALIARLAPLRCVQWIRADEVRSTMAAELGADDSSVKPSASIINSGLYSASRRDRVYQRCLEMAEAALERGEMVIVDATFASIEQRRHFAKVAHDFAVPWAYVECQLDAAQVQARLAARTHGPSQADWSVYQAMAATWPASTWLDHDLEAKAEHCLVVESGCEVERQVDELIGRWAWLQ